MMCAPEAGAGPWGHAPAALPSLGPACLLGRLLLLLLLLRGRLLLLRGRLRRLTGAPRRLLLLLLLRMAASPARGVGQRVAGRLSSRH
jgi:hypothetical protein